MTDEITKWNIESTKKAWQNETSYWAGALQQKMSQNEFSWQKTLQKIGGRCCNIRCYKRYHRWEVGSIRTVDFAK